MLGGLDVKQDIWIWSTQIPYIIEIRPFLYPVLKTIVSAANLNAAFVLQPPPLH